MIDFLVMLSCVKLLLLIVFMEDFVSDAVIPFQISYGLKGERKSPSS